jgi:UDP-2-acetamido-3-amino-2,3-dideoxy-glucuronate N-acetyltransferase
VTKDVPDHGLVLGNPARLVGYVCSCAQRLRERERRGTLALLECPACGAQYELLALT